MYNVQKYYHNYYQIPFLFMLQVNSYLNNQFFCVVKKDDSYSHKSCIYLIKTKTKNSKNNNIVKYYSNLFQYYFQLLSAI